MENEYCQLLSVSRNTYYVHKREKRPIIALLEKYFSKEDLEEFLTYGRVSKLEYLNATRDNELNLLFKFTEFLEALHTLHTPDDYLKFTMEHALSEEEQEEYEKAYKSFNYKMQCPNTIDYLCFAIIKNKDTGFNIFDILIRYYDEYKSQINDNMTSYYLDDIYNVCEKRYLDKELINFISINGSLYSLKKILDFREMTQINERFLEEMEIPIPLQCSNHQINLAMEFSIRYNLYLKKSNKNFEEIYNQYKVQEFGKIKIDYDKLKKDIETL